MLRITTGSCLQFLLFLNIFNGIHSKTKESSQTAKNQVQPRAISTFSNDLCGSLTDGSSFDKFEKCNMNEDYIGNTKQFVRLDFSKAQGGQISTFFGQAKNNTILSAAIRLVDNNNVTDVNLGEVIELKAARMDDKIFIEIVNNANLKEFKFNKVKKIENKVKVLIYNNPLLTWEQYEKGLITETIDKDNSVFETEKFACTFQNPQDKTKSIQPNPKLLPNCKIFQGDLKLESVSLSGEITFKDGCLHLVGVNMEKVAKINAAAGKGKPDCELANVSPKIENNPHLCGDKMAPVAAYMPNVLPKLHDTCTIICKDQDKVNDKFYRCSKIEADGIDFKNWFEPGYEKIADKLTEAKDISIKERGNVEKIDFPALTTVNNLEISGNTALKTLELSALRQANKLIITGNLQLTLNEIKKLSKDLKKGPDSEIECIATESTIVTDIDDLRHCTKITGPLVIRNVKKDVDPANFNIKEVTDCLTIEDTELTNLDFLEKAKIGCRQTQKLNNNPKLCEPAFLGQTGASVDHQRGKTKECGKKCTSLSENNCVIFEGNLTVDDKTPAADLAILEVINGKLTITGSATNLEFPALTSIVHSKAPALLITNNPKLASIKMPKIEKIEAGGEKPAVKIENSPKLTNLKDFLPSKIADTCSRSASTSCQYDKVEEKSWFKDNIPLLAGIAAGVVILGGAAGVGVFFYKRYKKKKKSKAKTHKSDEEESGGTIVDKSPEYEVLNAIQTRNPKTNNLAYLHNIAESVTQLLSGTIQFRIILRGKITDTDVYLEKLSQRSWEYYSGFRDRNRRINTERQRLNRHVYLVNEQYPHNLPEFNNAMLTAVQKTKADKKEEKKKEPTKEKKLDDKKTEKERTKAGKSKKGGGKKKGKKETGKKKATTEKSTMKTEKSTMKSAMGSESSVDSTASSAAPKTKTPDEPQKIKLIHIGPGFIKSMKFVKNLKISPLMDANGRPYRKVSDKFPSLRSTLILIELTDGKNTHTREVELTEMIVPELVIGQLHNLIQCPWISLLYYAWQNNIVIHTSVTDYFVCSFYFYTIIDLLNYRIKKERMNTSIVQAFSLTTLYPIYHLMIAAKGQKDFDEITAYTIYITCMLEWLREQIQKENVVAIELKKAVQQLVAADQIIYNRYKMKKTDEVHWDTYCRDVADVTKHPITVENNNLNYYKNFSDTTPYHLPPPGERLRYWPIVEYDENLDNLMKDVDTPSMLQRPVLSCSIKTEIEPKTVDSLVEAGGSEAPKPGEQKKAIEKKQTDQGVTGNPK